MRAVAVAALMVGALAACGRGPQIAALVASEALIAADWAQTRCHAANGWRGAYEQNPILGHAPSPGAVDVYMLGAAIGNLALWMVLPRGWNTAASTAVAGFELHTVNDNERNPCR